MKKFLAKSLITCLMLLLVGTLFVGCKENPPQNQVLDFELSQDFYNTDIYQNDIVNLNKFSIIVRNSVASDQYFTLDNFLQNGLDTSTLGENQFEITFNGFTKTFHYQVLEVTLVALTFKQNPIVYYKYEGFDLQDKEFVALYSNGKEKSIKLNLATITPSADNSLSQSETDTKQATAEYQGKSFKIEYLVKNRQISLNKQYKLIDTSGHFSCNETEDFTYRIIFTEKQNTSKLKFSILKYFSDNTTEPVLTGDILDSPEDNVYKIKTIENNKISTSLLYLTANGIVKSPDQSNKNP